jgi:GNAT superfamily N-acetyltransferase
MSVSVRRAVAGDGTAIARVHVAAWRWAYRDVMPPDVLESLSEDRRATFWTAAIESMSRETVWVAESDGAVVGFASAGPARDDDLDPETVELLTLYILEEHLGSGVGSVLIDAVEDSWRAEERTRAVLWVAADNSLGRSFYERKGWLPDATSKLEHVSEGEGIVALRYAKSLS